MIKHIDNKSRKQSMAHLSHLIQIAISDGKLEKSEYTLIQNYGAKMGITASEIDELIESVVGLSFIPPYEFSERFKQMYEIIKIILSDGKLANNEMRLASSLAVKYGFTENEIPKLLSVLLSGIKQNKTNDELFDNYKKGKR